MTNGVNGFISGGLPLVIFILLSHKKEGVDMRIKLPNADAHS